MNGNNVAGAPATLATKASARLSPKNQATDTS